MIYMIPIMINNAVPMMVITRVFTVGSEARVVSVICIIVSVSGFTRSSFTPKIMCSFGCITTT